MAAFTQVFVNTADLNARLVAAADSQIREIAQEAGKRMAKRATELMDQDFNLNRPYERRRHPGSRRAATAISSEVERTGTSDYTIRYKILGGEVVEARIAGLNYGIGPGHRILPSGNWPLKGARLFARTARNSGVESVFAQDKLAWTDEDTGQQVVTDEVWHPGMVRFPNGSSFLERARDEIAAGL